MFLEESSFPLKCITLTQLLQVIYCKSFYIEFLYRIQGKSTLPKDFMEKVDGWSPERHGEEKLKQFSISNAKFANKISLIAIFISIIALIVAIAVNLA